MIKFDLYSIIKMRSAAFSLILFSIVLGASVSVFADAPRWTYKGAKWYSMLTTGNLVVGTDGGGLVGISGETGQPIWTRADLKGIKETEITELEGTPFLLVADNSGWAQRKTKLFAVDLETGKNIWQTEKLLGFTAQVSPVYEKDMIVFLTIKDNRVTKDKPDITALRLSTGELLWQNEYTEKVDLYGVEKAKKSGFLSGGGGFFGDQPRYDLSGENPPVFDKDSMYLTYAGLHRYDLATGKLLWKLPYDVTEGSLKRTNGQAIVDGETVYTSAKGIVRAIDKNSGAVKWQTKDLNSGGIAEMVQSGDVIYGRLGGNFYSDKQKDYLKKSPIGVVALSKQNGAVLWNYTGAKNSITNMVLLPEQNALLIADEKNIIALDTNSSGKVKEAYKMKLEFTRSLNATDVASKAIKGMFGGLKGLASKGADRTDEPVALIRQENGTVVARGKQHILAFDPRSRVVAWTSFYDAPGIPAWQKIAMTAITAYLSGAASANLSRGENSGSFSEARQANKDYDAYWSGYEQAMNKRYNATKQSGNFVYVLTKIKSGKDSGTGLMGVDMLTGNASRQILINDKKPDYEIDEATGRLFNLDDNQIVAYNITEVVAQEGGDEKKDKKKKDKDD